MTTPVASYYPKGLSVYVPSCEYAIDGDIDNKIKSVSFGAILTLSTTYFASAVLSTTGVALVLQLSDGSLLNNGLVPGTTTTAPSLWGRGLTFVGDGASTRTIAVAGFDYLGQAMTWTGTMNGTTPVLCPKAFMWITSITFGAAADTVSVSVGYNNVMGLPYALDALISEIKNGAIAANAGTIVAALADATPSTATTADTRGTYLPVTVIPNGTNTFKIVYAPRVSNLHGNAAA